MVLEESHGQRVVLRIRGWKEGGGRSVGAGLVGRTVHDFGTLSLKVATLWVRLRPLTVDMVASERVG